MSVIEIAAPVAPLVETDDEVAAVLERAADLLVEKGWAQNVNCAADGSMCARGALQAASVGHTESVFFDAQDQLLRYLHVDSVVTWNDSMNMTADDVIRAMKEAAAHGE